MTTLSQERREPWRWGGFALLVLIVAIAFGRPLLDLVRFATETDTYSHIILIPFVTAYLIYTDRRRLAGIPRRCSWLPGGLLALAGLLSAALWLWLRHTEVALSRQDLLFFCAFSVVTLTLSGVFLCFGSAFFRAFRLPLLFLYFAVPFTSAMEAGIERVLQVGSADALQGLSILTGTPLFRDGMCFHFPGLSVEVATQCSGIRSSLVLLMTGLLAGHVFLVTPWRKWLLVLLVIPLGLLRNAARILTIVLVTTKIDPDAINGPLHRRGGPPFFVLSLIVLLAILFVLRMTERTRRISIPKGEAEHRED